MEISKRVYLRTLYIILNLLFSQSLAKQGPKIWCGKIKILPPFAPQNPLNSSILSRMVLCKSEKLYFRTTLGLFPISFIDYKAKLLVISHNSSSLTSSNFISPLHLSAGFPSPPQPNSLILFDCSKPRQNHPMLPYFRNCKDDSFLGLSRKDSCLVVDDVGNLDMGFDPKNLDCSGYSKVYRSSNSNSNSNSSSSSERFELGTRVSFDIPDHAPNPCRECEKKDGNCGAGLRCICHPKDCKDKIVSLAVRRKRFGNTIIILSLLIWTLMK